MLCCLCSIHSIVCEIVSTISSYQQKWSTSKNAIANENGQIRQTVDKKKNGPILSKSTQFASDTNKSVLYTLGLGYIGNNNTRYYNYQSTTTNIKWFS